MNENKPEFKLDPNKPLYPQMVGLGPDYVDYVMRPHVLVKKLRLFESDFLEFFTSTHWSTIPIIWLPVAGLSTFIGAYDWKLSTGEILCFRDYCLIGLMFAMGLLIW